MTVRRAGRDLDALVAAMTLAEKVSLTAGADMWTVPGVERLGIPPVTVTDGPNGARGTALLGAGLVTALCVPCGSALGATWDPALVEEVGRALGQECRTKSARVLLAPTINLHRSPIAGRNFECYSEDPLLSGLTAAAFVRGVQAEGVAATVKHFVGNEAEFQRNTISSDISERALRELYLRPFEMAVTEGGVRAVMTAYNRVNGRWCTEDGWLLTELLREEWGFDGIVMTDWFGVADTSTSPSAGLDLEMPGPGRAYGDALGVAVESGEIEPATVDAMVRRWLGLVDALDAWDDQPEPERAVDDPDRRDVAFRAATSSMVLCHNRADLLPLPTDVGSVALIGPTASVPHLMGGGSAQLNPHHRTAPARVFADRLGDRLTVREGCIIDRHPRVLPGSRLQTPDGEAGVRVELWDGLEPAGPPVHVARTDDTRLLFFGSPAPDITEGSFCFRATTTFTPTITGTHELSLVQLGRARVLVGGEVVLDGMTDSPGPGTQFFKLASAEVCAPVDLVAGEPVEVIVEYRSEESFMLFGAKVGLALPPIDHLQAAVEAAAAADVTIVIVGTSDEWESEGEDRADMDLPGDQDELVRRVAAVNPATVVVVNAGSPVSMPWADEVGAVVYSWLGGQEYARALDAVLFGDAEPGGRLPVTLPLRLEHNPTYGSFPGENDHLRYGEDLLVGYRWYDTRKLPVRFPFGHGGSYTRFEWGMPEVSPASLSADDLTAGDPSTKPACTVSVRVTNVGDRPGTEVVQCYVRPSTGALHRPDRELGGFATVHLAPGESVDARIELPPRAFAHWDPGSPDADLLRARTASVADVVPVGEGAEIRRPGWWVDAGVYTLELSRSVDDVVASVAVTVDGVRLGPRSG